MAGRTAILFFTHTFDRDALQHLTKLRSEVAGCDTLFILNDGSTPIPSNVPDPVHVFRFADLRARYPQPFGDRLIPGNPHLAFIDFCEHHPEIDYLWVIEYDVWFSGRWKVLFDDFRDIEADLIASHIHPHRQDPGWHWWPTLRSPPGQPQAPHTALVRAFLPVHRTSRRALLHVRDKLLEGWSGHFECLMPTMMAEAGMTLVDLGGTGPYVRTGLAERYYTNTTMRYRPVHLFRGTRKNQLYHPIKRRTPRSLVEVSRFWLSHMVRRHVLERLKKSER